MKGDTFGTPATAPGATLVALTAHTPTGPSPATTWLLNATSTAVPVINKNIPGVMGDVTNGGTYAVAYLSDTASGTDYQAEIDFSQVGAQTHDGSYVGCGVSVDTTLFTGYFVYFVPGVGGGIVLSRLVAGSESFLGGGQFDFNGLTGKIRIRRVGAVLTAFLNDAIIIGPATDSSPIAGPGRAGLLIKSINPALMLAGTQIERFRGYISVTPGAATQLAVTKQPYEVVTNHISATPFLVSVEDAEGSVLTTDTRTITATFTTVSGEIHGTGTVSKAAVAGVATFDDLFVKGSQNAQYTVTFATSGLTSATTAPIYVDCWSSVVTVTCT